MPKDSRRAARVQRLKQELRKRILVVDGAMGTAIQGKNLTAKDFGGPQYEGCNEYLVITRPDVIRDIHTSYLEAGCDIVETNTFGGTPVVLAEYDLAPRAHEINLAAARIARDCADRLSTPEKPRFVAGSIGPTTKAISVTGGITFDELIENFRSQAVSLIEGGVDYLLIETAQDGRNIKAAFLGIDKALAETGEDVPVAVSGTIEPMGTMLAGQSVESLMASLAHRDLLYLGLNCATGPEFMTDHIRSLAQLSPFPVACVPNAGLPDEEGHYLETPEMIAAIMDRFVSNSWVNVVGGCCGTHAGHIAALAAHVKGKAPRATATDSRSFLSGVDYLEITDELRPVIVGERTNVIGSRAFKKLIAEGKFEEASEIARAQVKGGAQIIDVCLADPDREEKDDLRAFLEKAVKKIRAPMMIDSTDAECIEVALTYCQGKSIINSVNLEDGEERFEKVIPLARRYGAALVVGTIDDDPVQGMGVKRERKLEIAEREYDLLTRKYGVKEEDIYWDPLVFPCATGDQQYVGSAVETIEGVRLLKARFPRTKTVLGISNVSFGLPPAGREVLNSVFLYHCVQAGLDLAIVNAEKLERFSSIPEEERKLAEDLIWNRGADPIAAFAAHFREKKVKAAVDRSKIPLDDRLAGYIIEGSKDGLVADLDEAMKGRRPLDIINGPLMKGMDEVGRLFNDNKLIVAEVLQSAEAMKAAVAHLEPFMEKADAASRGKVLLATVKGDVHDIGKNLVEIILGNNGFNVVNLGIKVPPEKLIEAIREHKPDIVGLSGLLVKSAQQMVVTADDFARAGVSTPMLVGGAALSENFVDMKIAGAYTSGLVTYASDAMRGLDLAKQIVDPKGFEELGRVVEERRSKKHAARAKLAPVAAPESTTRSKGVPIVAPADLPRAPDFDRHVIKNTPIDQIWRFVNPLMLYGRHLGVKGGVVRLLEKAAHDPVARREAEETQKSAVEIWEAVQKVKDEFRGTEIMQPACVYQFFRASSEGNRLHLYPAGSNGHPKAVATFEFPRQRRDDGTGLCLSDYASPEAGSGDTIALFCTTAGRGVRQMAESLKNRGDYLKSHILQALALETAESYAEMLHAQIRSMWGFPDAPELTMMERFQAKYRGKRYSFGYPACPRLDDQSTLFRLIRPEEIGVNLTEGFMMDPEASVSAIVFHHPSAIYYSVGTGGEAGEENRG